MITQKEALKEVIQYFAKKDRIEHYMSLYNVNIKNALIKSYGSTLYGSMDDKKHVQCTPHYVEIKAAEGTSHYGWDFITEKVKEQLGLIERVEQHEQLSLF